MNKNPYKLLAERLNTLPNGYPPTESGIELRLLEKLFTPAEALLASELRITLETPEEISVRRGGDPQELKKTLKGMTQKGLIRAGKTNDQLGFGLLPFVIGIYEYQIGRIDAELAQLFEDYYQQAFVEMTSVEPKFHRVVPVGETVRNDMEVYPFESAASIVENAKAWGIRDCICRVQKELIGDPCDHLVEACMTLSPVPGSFDNSPVDRALSKEQALATLRRVADAGLVHSVSNSQDGTWYICNCCTCSCGILRGMTELGVANVIARSAFVNTVDPEECVACEDCVEHCQFDALSLDPEDPYIQISEARCVGCGVCVPVCQESALSLVRRPEEDIIPIPETHTDWMKERAAARGLQLSDIL